MRSPTALAQRIENEEDFTPALPACPAIDVLGIRVDVMNMEQVLSRIGALLARREKGYLSAITVHGVMLARRDAEFAAAFADAAIAIPDGTPIAWAGRLQGHPRMQYVTGPDLMREVFLRKEFAGYTHFFYGGDVGVAEDLAAHFRKLAPWARIVGTFTPPFRPLTKIEERGLIAQIKQCKPDMIWVGLGTPKQDKFMRRFLPKLDATLMFGVGAAFDFHTGRIRDCSRWIKNAGMQWLHRLLQDPKRLWWRYMRDNPAFLLGLMLQLARRTLSRRRFGESDKRTRKKKSEVVPYRDADENAANWQADTQ
jgi:N-acetylglucosaminyldiphosphoundecaprenol N-acetyl-beta-D-mannosaminyltransferase